MRYIALLRGINVGGKNKVSMSELRDCFGDVGFTNVSTYINSGNVLFDSNESSIVSLVEKCEIAIEKQFGFKVVTMIVSSNDFKVAVDQSPEWWGDVSKNNIRSDALFVIPPTTTREVRSAMKVDSKSPDTFYEYGQILFWSLPLESYSKSVVPKIIGTPIYSRITIRGSKTVRKLYDLLQSNN